MNYKEIAKQIWRHGSVQELVERLGGGSEGRKKFNYLLSSGYIAMGINDSDATYRITPLGRAFRKFYVWYYIV